eukprot:5290588-Pleurochrysis_carterae.AAC.1
MTDGGAAEAPWAYARGSAWYRAATAHADAATPMQEEEGNSTRVTAGMGHLTAPTRCVRRGDVEGRGIEDTDGARAVTHAPPEDRHARRRKAAAELAARAGNMGLAGALGPTRDDQWRDGR